MSSSDLVFFAVAKPDGLTVRPVQPAPSGFTTSKNPGVITIHFSRYRPLVQPEASSHPLAAHVRANLPRISCTRFNGLLVRLIRGKSCKRQPQMGQDFPRGVLATSDGASLKNSALSPSGPCKGQGERTQRRCLDHKFLTPAPTAPEPSISAISSSRKPSTSRRISPVCSPSSGERTTSEGLSDILIGLPTVRYFPRAG